MSEMDIDGLVSSFLDGIAKRCSFGGLATTTVANRALGNTNAMERMRRDARRLTERIMLLTKYLDGEGVPSAPMLAPDLPPLLVAPDDTPPPLTVDLPLPPTNNDLHAPVQDRKTGKPRKIATDKYRSWKTQAGHTLNAQKPKMPARSIPRGWRYSVLILLPMGARGDAANYEKAATDLLVAHQVVPDDRYVDDNRQRRDPSIPAGMCRVILTPTRLAASK